jgi:hypothetical protein
VEVPYHFHVLVADGQLLFGCNLRHVAEQSEHHPGDRLSQWGGCCALSTSHIFALSLILQHKVALIYPKSGF